MKPAQPYCGEVPASWLSVPARGTVIHPSVLASAASSPGGGLVSIRELEEHTGRTFPQVRADLGGLTRTCRTRLKKPHWPFAAVWAADGKAQMSYRVPAEVLRWWHEA